MGTNEKTLILAESNDIHAETVKRHLLKMGVSSLFLDTKNFPEKMEAGVIYTPDDTRALLSFPEYKVDLSQYGSVWFRRYTPPLVSSAFNQKTRGYVQKQSEKYLYDLALCLDHCFWVSEPVRQILAGRKLHQLKRAEEVGLKIPDTFMGNSPDLAMEFIKKQPDYLIVKQSSSANAYMGLTFFQKATLILKELFDARPSFNISEKYMNALDISTQQVTKKELLDKIALIKNCPIIIQPLIEKKYELRITVVGKKNLCLCN